MAEDRWSSAVDAASTSDQEQRSGEISISFPRAAEIPPPRYERDETDVFGVLEPIDRSFPDQSSGDVRVAAPGIVPLVVVTAIPTPGDSLRPVVSMPPTIRPRSLRSPRSVRSLPLVASAALVVLAVALATAVLSSRSLVRAAAASTAKSEPAAVAVPGSVIPRIAPRR